MSPETPRTDAARTNWDGNFPVVPLGFARTLERELTTALAEVAREREANAELARMLNIARDVIRANDLKEIERLGNPFADPSHVQAIEQRDALRERVRVLGELLQSSRNFLASWENTGREVYAKAEGAGVSYGLIHNTAVFRGHIDRALATPPLAQPDAAKEGA